MEFYAFVDDAQRNSLITRTLIVCLPKSELTANSPIVCILPAADAR